MPPVLDRIGRWQLCREEAYTDGEVATDDVSDGVLKDLKLGGAVKCVGHCVEPGYQGDLIECLV